eukprot:6098780-Prymnesium_polylepis.2
MQLLQGGTRRTVAEVSGGANSGATCARRRFACDRQMRRSGEGWGGGGARTAPSCVTTVFSETRPSSPSRVVRRSSPCAMKKMSETDTVWPSGLIRPSRQHSGRTALASS